MKTIDSRDATYLILILDNGGGRCRSILSGLSGGGTHFRSAKKKVITILDNRVPERGT